MIESINDFNKRLNEVDILIKYAQANQHSIDKCKLFLKAAIVLLCSHFEVFIEAFIEEHVDLIKANYNNITLPQYMKDNFIDDTFNSYKNVPKPSKKQKPLKALFQLYGNAPLCLSSLSDLMLDTKYGFGKHGQSETDRIFKKFGFGNFVNTTDYKGPFIKINSAIAIRNNIIHEGSAPTLSCEDLVDYKTNFQQFTAALERYMIENQENYYGKVVF